MAIRRATAGEISGIGDAQDGGVRDEDREGRRGTA
jgi:hypothetical protein